MFSVELPPLANTGKALLVCVCLFVGTINGGCSGRPFKDVKTGKFSKDGRAALHLGEVYRGKRLRFQLLAPKGGRFIVQVFKGEIIGDSRASSRPGEWVGTLDRSREYVVTIFRENSDSDEFILLVSSPED